MIDSNDIKKIKETTEEFFDKMTISVSNIDVKISSLDSDLNIKNDEENKDTIVINIDLTEPQILIGQGGQTLFETQRILRMILNKKLQKIFYLDLDINDYKNKKTEHLKLLAKDLADQVVATKETKVLIPMPAYERRVIHQELSKRTDVVSDSEGGGPDRHIIIKIK
jgi:spoIIIJ-associated protein